MEIKLNTGDKITIPEDCEATIEGNQIIIKKQEGFKDGDVVHSINDKTILIFKETCEDDSKYFYSHYIPNCGTNGCWNKKAFRHATVEERQILFDKMKEQGLKWNAETKQVEKIRGRVPLYSKYLFINSYGNVSGTIEYNDPSDDRKFNSGNYYLLEEREQAEKDAERIKAIFKERIKLK